MAAMKFKPGDWVQTASGSKALVKSVGPQLVLLNLHDKLYWADPRQLTLLGRDPGPELQLQMVSSHPQGHEI